MASDAAEIRRILTAAGVEWQAKKVPARGRDKLVFRAFADGMSMTVLRDVYAAGWRVVETSPGEMVFGPREDFSGEIRGVSL